MPMQQTLFESQSLPGTVPVAYLADFDHFDQEKEKFDKVVLSVDQSTGYTTDSNIALENDDLLRTQNFNTDESGIASGTNLGAGTHQVSPLESSDVNEISLGRKSHDKDLITDELDTVSANQDVMRNSSFSENMYDPLSTFDSEDYAHGI